MKIEKDIPMPEIGTRRKKYPFAKMEHGDSFFIQCLAEESSKVQSNAHSSFRNEKRHPGKRLVSRKEDDGVRFWMIFLEQEL